MWKRQATASSIWQPSTRSSKVCDLEFMVDDEGRGNDSQTIITHNIGRQGMRRMLIRCSFSFDSDMLHLHRNQKYIK